MRKFYSTPIAPAMLKGFLFTPTEKSDPDVETKIIGIWTIKNVIGLYSLMGQMRRDTTEYTSRDFIMFNSDGSLNIIEGSTIATGTWKITDNKLAISGTNYMDSAGFEIHLRNSHELCIHRKINDSIGMTEQWVNLKKEVGI